MSPLKKQLFDLEVKGQGPTKVITVRDTPPYGHAPTCTYQISLTYLEKQKSYDPDKLRWEEAEAAEDGQIRLNNMSPFVRSGDINIWIECLMIFFHNYRSELEKMVNKEFY